MKNKRTKKSAIIACGVAAIVAISGAFAFMTDHDNAVNKFNFTDSDGNQSIDIQLTETNWKEANGEDIQYGVPVAKNPQATNLGANPSYVFATVIVPAEKVAVQNALGGIIDPATGAPVSNDNLGSIGMKAIVANNVSPADIAANGDETEILGVYSAFDTDFDEDDAIAFGEEVPTSFYFKLNSASPYGEAVTGKDYKVLADTHDAGKYTSEKLGHDFMLGVVVDPNVAAAAKELELYHFLTLDANDPSGYGRTNVSKTPAADYEGWTVDLNTADANNIYSRNSINAPAGENAGWVEVTGKIGATTVYIDGDNTYVAHVYMYSAPLAPDATTVSIFDAVELANLAPGQLDETTDMNIYVEVYSVQSEGLADVLGSNKATSDAGIAAIWAAMTNSEANGSFDMFSVVKDTND